MIVVQREYRRHRGGRRLWQAQLGRWAASRRGTVLLSYRFEANLNYRLYSPPTIQTFIRISWFYCIANDIADTSITNKPWKIRMYAVTIDHET